VLPRERVNEVDRGVDTSRELRKRRRHEDDASLQEHGRKDCKDVSVVKVGKDVRKVDLLTERVLACCPCGLLTW